MTNEETLNWCYDFQHNIVTNGVFEEKHILALQAMQTAMTALEKQIPQKVVGLTCPKCKKMFFLHHGERVGEGFCGRCGQALKWGKSND